MDRGKLALGIVVALVALVLYGIVAMVSGLPLGLMGGPETIFILVPLLIFAGFVLTVAAVIHALVRDDLTGIQRLIWILISVFIPFGALVYFLLGRTRTRDLFRDVGASDGGDGASRQE